MHDTTFIFPNDANPVWSIMIVLYPYITGLVAGAFVVSALYHVFHRDVLKPVARLALVTSLCFCAFATLPLLLHLHHPERAFNVMITPHFRSAIAGFGIIYSAYMLILVIEVWLVLRPSLIEQGNRHAGLVRLFYRLISFSGARISDRCLAIDQWIVRLLAIIGIPVACVLHGYVGFLFGAVKANPWWSTSLMPVIFLISAVVSGIAALIVLYLVICWRQRETPDSDCVRALARYLWIFLVLAITLEGLEILHMAYESSGEWDVIYRLLTERLFVSYGIVQVLLGSVVPLVLLLTSFIKRFPRRMVMFSSGLASLLVLVQVFAMRWNVVVGGQLFSKSFRGFTEFTLPWLGREGLIAAAVVLSLPLIALWIAGKTVPLCEMPAARSRDQVAAIE